MKTTPTTPRSKSKSLKKRFFFSSGGDVLSEMEPHDVRFFFFLVLVWFVALNRGNPKIYNKFHGSLANSHHHGRSTEEHCPQK